MPNHITGGGYAIKSFFLAFHTQHDIQGWIALLLQLESAQAGFGTSMNNTSFDTYVGHCELGGRHGVG